MSKVYGYRMAHDERDQLTVWLMFRRAIDRRAPVRVSYFKRKTENHNAVNDRFGNPVYVKVTRVVEPYALERTEEGEPIVRVIDRAPEGAGSRPGYRSIRLDRVAIRYADGMPLATPLYSYGFLCPSPLDGNELHPNKGELTARRKKGALVAYN